MNVVALKQELSSPLANLYAEQGLIGAILYDNAAFERADGLTAEHFYEPMHGLMFETIGGAIAKGAAADVILIDSKLAPLPAYQELGGIRYLADLLDNAPTAAVAHDYAKLISDLALRRRVVEISGDATAAVSSDHEATARDHIERLEQQLYALAETKSLGGFNALSHYLEGAVEMVAEAFQREGDVSGIATGLIDLDRKLGGLHPSDLLILAARPSMGKTSLAVNIAYNVARRYAYEARPDGQRKALDGGVVGFFSLEMSGEQLGLRLLSEVSGVSGDKIRRGEIDRSEYHRVVDAAQEINSLPLYIDATGGISIAKLAARARRLKRTVGLDLLIVDYLQLVTSAYRRGGSRVEEVSEVTQALKALAKELNVPLIALSQLSRAVEQRDDKRPQLSDLRESGSIEQDADCVMFIYREEYYLSRVEPEDKHSLQHIEWTERMDVCRGVADVIIGKQRHGPIGSIKLAFDANLTRFGNLANGGF